MSFARSLALAFALSALAGAARAATAEDEANAERMFQEAKALMAAGKVHDACTTLESAKALERGGGIVLALGLCLAKDRRNASALAELREALALAIDAKRTDRVTLAEKEIARLEACVSRLMIVAPKTLGIRVNGEPWDPARLGAAVPVDGGQYVVRAEAAGEEPWQTVVQIAAERDSQKIEVPPLADARLEPPPAVAELAPSAPPVAPVRGDPPHGRRVAGYVAGGIGLAGVAVGATFGGLALSKRSDATCQGHLCPGAGGTYDASKTDATASTIAFVAGGLGIASGALLLFTTLGSSNADVVRVKTSLTLVPQPSVGGAQVSIAGRF